MEGERKVCGLGDVQIYYDGFLAAADYDGFDGLVGAGVHFLMGYVGRDIDEIAGAGFFGEFEMVAPAEEGVAFHDVEDGFDCAMMVRGGAGGGFD